jgi:hypothetical protein
VGLPTVKRASYPGCRVAGARRVLRGVGRTPHQFYQAEHVQPLHRRVLLTGASHERLGALSFSSDAPVLSASSDLPFRVRIYIDMIGTNQ